MNCRRIEALIPLYVENDLDERCTADVRSHLQGCPECRTLVDEYEASQSWLHSYEPPDFDESFVDGIRLSVMSEIAEQNDTPSFIAWMMMWLIPRRLAAATVALIIAIIALSLLVYSNRSRDAHMDVAIKDPLTPEVAGNPDNLPPGSTNKQLSAPTPKRHRAVLSPARYPRRNAGRAEMQPDKDIAQQQPLLNVPPTVPVTDNDAGNDSEEMLRIELQTADPNIRIIWFAPKQSGDTTKPMSETR